MVVMLGQCLCFVSTLYILYRSPVPLTQRLEGEMILVQLIQVRRFWAGLLLFLLSALLLLAHIHTIFLHIPLHEPQHCMTQITAPAQLATCRKWITLKWWFLGVMFQHFIIILREGSISRNQRSNIFGMTMITKDPHGWASICTTVFFNKVLVPYHGGYWKRLNLGFSPNTTMASLIQGLP